jgi:hypothetical protein
MCARCEQRSSRVQFSRKRGVPQLGLQHLTKPISHPHDALHYLTLGFGGADIVLNRDQRRRENRSRMADDSDYDILGYQDTPLRPGAGVRFGPLPYRDMRR